jgi:hypothetical protein
VARKARKAKSPAQIAAARANIKKAQAARKGKSSGKLTPSQKHGSGTGLTSAHRYLPSNVKKREGTVESVAHARATPRKPNVAKVPKPDGLRNGVYHKGGLTLTAAESKRGARIITDSSGVRKVTPSKR